MTHRTENIEATDREREILTRATVWVSRCRGVPQQRHSSLDDAKEAVESGSRTRGGTVYGIWEQGDELETGALAAAYSPSRGWKTSEVLL